MSLITLVSGVSTSGKTMLVQALAEEYPKEIVVPVANTTRPLREGELNGVAYYSVSPETYGNYVGEGIMLTDIVYNGNRYGYTCGEFARKLMSGKRILAVVDRFAIGQIRKIYPETAALFFDAEYEEQLLRMAQRDERDAKRGQPPSAANLEPVIHVEWRKRLEISHDEREWARQNADTLILVPPELTFEEKFALLERIIFDR